MSDTENGFERLRRDLAPQHAAEERAVRSLGERIGYGRMMQLCEQLWRASLIAQGLPGGGEFAVGTCAAMLCACPCADRVRCDWCCGTGRVTHRVRDAMLVAQAHGAPR